MGVTGTTFDPSVAGAGTHTLTYSTNSLPTTAPMSRRKYNCGYSKLSCSTNNNCCRSICLIAFAQQWLQHQQVECGVQEVLELTSQVLVCFLLVQGLVGTNKVIYTLTNALVLKDSINVTVIYFIPATIIRR